MNRLLEVLKMPEARRIGDLDDPETSVVHGLLIQKKPFLRNTYADFYQRFRREIDDLFEDQVLVELGSGGGFIKEIIAGIITSDIQRLPNVDTQFSGTEIPLKSGSVDAFFMIDVFHHVPDSYRFLGELERCLKPGGKIVMIEPANTRFSRLIFRRLHHETFDPLADWSFKSTGPLSSANGALPWIVFVRDRRRFEEQFGSLAVHRIECHTPFRYLLSGGLSYRQLLPTFSYRWVFQVERLTSGLHGHIGMFQTIVVQKRRPTLSDDGAASSLDSG